MRIIIQHGTDWLRFLEPVEVLTARTPEEVFQCLEKIEQSGLWAAGFVSYEAAGAFDDALTTCEPGALPLLHFGLFQTSEKVELQPGGEYSLGDWTPSVVREEYTEAIATIKERIAAGDTYQVNYTFRLHAGFEGDPFGYFCDLAAAQQGDYGAFIETGDFAICSASPELFFELKDGLITSRPMKGTRPRGLTAETDWAAAAELQRAEKDRAENIMIVDMIRNDIGRVAEAGSVETVSRFDVEKYPTVWQMTSTVRGTVEPQNKACRSPKAEVGLRSRTETKRSGAAISNHEVSGAGDVDATSLSGQLCGKECGGDTAYALGELFGALFPCASITGAPKAKTMEIIRELETSSRGIYTGSIGFVAPDGNACFNVAIRTAVLDRNAGTMEYGIGGGIVWDSDAEAEYDEALSKAAILTKKMPEFQLLETMLWKEGELFLLDRHLKRLTDSAERFDFKMKLDAIRAELEGLLFDEPMKIRLLLSLNGEFGVEAASCRWPQPQDAVLAISREPVDSKDVFLYHKTTNRAVYGKAKADFPDADDVLLYNERGEVTESSIANVVVELDGHKLTPPVSCGLLAGTFRDKLLAQGEIEEGVIVLEDLKRAEGVWLINSVRKWQEAKPLSIG